MTIPQPADLGLVEEKLLLKAIEAAQEKVRRSPDDAEVWGQLGHVYLSPRVGGSGDTVLSSSESVLT